MFLKIGLRERDGHWKIIGDLVDVEYNYPASMEDRMGYSVDDQFCNVEPASDAKHPLVQVICTRDNGKTIEVLTNSIIYLCNDAGKTIERLTA